MIYTFDSTQAGAPVLSGTAGALATVLKACLVDGFGAGAVVSLVVTAGVAKATYSASHPFRVGAVGRFAGATPMGLNGDKLIVATTANSASFAAPGVPDGQATGSITSRMAPAGWQELFAGTATNVFVVKPSVVEATGCVLRVDDSGTTNARVRGYESMSDAVTGVGPMPLDVQVAGGLWWSKSGTAGATARPWYVCADERAVYLAVAPQGGDRYSVVFAGDIASCKSGDAYSFALTGNQSDQVGATAVPDGCCGYSHRNARGGAYLARAHTGIGQAVAAQRIGAHHNGASADVYAGTAGYSQGMYPNGPNNGLLSGVLELYATAGVRGRLPGLLHPIQDCSTAFATGAVVDGTDDFLGRRLLGIRTAPPTGAQTPGTVFLDTTGPWSR